MKKTVITTTLAGIAAAPAAMAAPTAIPVEADETRTDDLLARAMQGKARPAEVADAMKALGMDAGTIEFDDVLFDQGMNPSLDEKMAHTWCNSNWCVIVKPDFEDAPVASVSPDLKDRLAARKEQGGLTLAEILEEMDADAGENWSVVIGENRTAVIS